MSRRRKKILPNFCCSAKLHTDVVVLQSLHFSQALCVHLSSCILCCPPPAAFRLGHMFVPSAYAYFSPPYAPPRQARPPRRNDELLLMTVGEETSMGGWVGVLKSRTENRLKVRRTEYKSTLTTVGRKSNDGTDGNVGRIGGRDQGTGLKNVSTIL